MRMIGIAGSPRRNGNSTALMRAALEGACAAGAETCEVTLNDLTYKGCQGCEVCNRRGCCILNDDLTPIIERLRQADGWVLAAPIYYDGVSGQFKTFFDRLRTLTHDSETMALAPQLDGPRRAVIIVTYEDHDRADYEHVAAVLARYLGWMGDFSEVEVLCEGRLDGPQAASQRPDLLARAQALGRSLVRGA